MDDSLELTKGVEARVDHSSPVKEGVEVWRIIIKFISNIPEENRLIKEYFVWVTGEFLEDQQKLSADIQSAERFALQHAAKRFNESGNQVPIENGVYCSNEGGIVIVEPKTVSIDENNG